LPAVVQGLFGDARGANPNLGKPCKGLPLVHRGRAEQCVSLWNRKAKRKSAPSVLRDRNHRAGIQDDGRMTAMV
jgi:hypothetical protein